MNVQDRFMSKVSPVPIAGCWLWDGFYLRDGYGGFNVDNRIVIAHRLSWQLHRGEIPDRMFVLHRCDVACCVNPDHLFLGTQADNMRDKVAKGRQARGQKHGMAKLTDTQLSDIKHYLRYDLHNVRMIAETYGVTPERIYQIRAQL